MDIRSFLAACQTGLGFWILDPGFWNLALDPGSGLGPGILDLALDLDPGSWTRTLDAESLGQGRGYGPGRVDGCTWARPGPPWYTPPWVHPPAVPG